METLPYERIGFQGLAQVLTLVTETLQTGHMMPRNALSHSKKKQRDLTVEDPPKHLLPHLRKLDDGREEHSCHQASIQAVLLEGLDGGCSK